MFQLFQETTTDDGETMYSIGVATNKTEYKYGDATIVVPGELYLLLLFFVEWIRPHLLRGEGKVVQSQVVQVWERSDYFESFE